MRGLSWLPLLLPVVGAAECCGDEARRLQFGTPVAASVASGSWVDFLVVGQNDGDTLAFELEAASKNPTALGVYVYDGVVADTEVPASQRCLLCQGAVDGAAVTSVSALHPASGAPTSSAALDVDTVSQIGNSTHRRYFVYVSECYQMKGSVYYVSVFGQTSSAVDFTITAHQIPSRLTVTSSADEAVTRGQVCDGKYMHYFVDWGALHPGGMQAHVQVTSGELSSFSLRKERCGGRPDADIASVNLLSYGRSEGKVKLPNSHAPLELARYYVSVRATPDLCGNFTIALRNLTQHEFHTA